MRTTARSRDRDAIEPADTRAGSGRGAGRWLGLLALLTFAVSTAGAGEEPHDPLFSADGYRVARFDYTVPDHLDGAVAVDTDAARLLLARGAVHPVDVLPSPPRPAGLAPGTLWLPPSRRNIPGSTWLPNVGYGVLSESLEFYFRSNLRRISGGNPAAGLLIYCRADCWMSWNAARRAVRWGYTNVHWYADGTTGWEAAGLPLETSLPEPGATP